MLQPAIFLGHGNPMNALAENGYTAVWRRLGENIPRPNAIVSVSAHWFVPGTRVTANKSPETIHDFGGFPRKLYEVRYPAPGDPDLARRLQALLAPLPVKLDESWGLDHGTWSVLRHMYPDADIPVVQLSVDQRGLADFHFHLGRRLALLREENILLMGSGNLVHNLRSYVWEEQTDPYDWAVRFETKVKEKMLAGEFESVINYQELGKEALLSVPTPDHYFPLLYVLATRQQGEPITFPLEGMDGGSLSMLIVRIG